MWKISFKEAMYLLWLAYKPYIIIGALALTLLSYWIWGG